MSAPPLTRLRTEHGQAAGPAEPAPLELPDELWVQILMAVQMDDPCRELMKWCETEKKWAKWCRDGTLYEAANRKLGWYGDFASLQAVQAHVARMDFPIWTPPPTAKLYFQAVCDDLSKVRGTVAGSRPNWMSERRYMERPHYSLLASKVLEQRPRLFRQLPADCPKYEILALWAVARDATVFEFVPTTLPNYHDIATLACTNWGLSIEHVPTERDDYPQLAKLAVQNRARALGWVPETTRGYREIAEVAVRHDGSAIAYVRQGRDDYVALARLAMEQDGGALQNIDQDHPAYAELAEIAVANKPLMLRILGHMDNQSPEYVAIAKIAVAGSVTALRWAFSSMANYDEVCRFAVSAHGRSLEYVRRDSDVNVGGVSTEAYADIVKLAVQQDGLALAHVPPTFAGYARVAKIAILQTPVAIRSLRHYREDDEDIILEAITDGASETALSYVPLHYPHYYEIAVSAVEHAPYAVTYVDTRHEQYREILEDAVSSNHDVLEHVPQDDPELYTKLALIAVDDQQSGPDALDFVPMDVQGIDYYEIAKRAILNDGRAIRFVPANWWGYVYLARIAVKQSKYALGYIPKDNEIYPQMAALQAERMAPPSPEHDYGV